MAKFFAAQNPGDASGIVKLLHQAMESGAIFDNSIKPIDENHKLTAMHDLFQAVLIPLMR